MNYSIIILDEVIDELKDAVEYYKNLNPNLQTKLESDWDDTLDAIVKTPLGFQIRRKNFRCISLMQFPYVVVYKVEETTIIVYRFIHERKKPQKRYTKRK